MKTQNLNSLNGLEAAELTNAQMEVITGGRTANTVRRPEPPMLTGSKQASIPPRNNNNNNNNRNR